MKRIVPASGNRAWGKRAYVIFALCLATAITLPAASFTTLYSFCTQSGCTDGAQPTGGLVQATNGDLYGTTSGGGANTSCGSGGCGTVFKITLGGALTTLYNFCALANCSDGDSPSAGLLQATNGDLYGATRGIIAGFQGANPGTIFKITQNGTLTTLHNFCSLANCADGAEPTGGLVQATNGDLYGTTYVGWFNFGTVFKITPSGTLTTLHSFCSQKFCTDGEGPWAGLAEAANGDFYGTTLYGGAYGGSSGTVFKITPTGALTTLYSFCEFAGCQDGDELFAGLLQPVAGDLYGTTQGGGDYSSGTIFKITPSGTLTTLYSFCELAGCPDGAGPGALIDANGDLYGTTSGGGANGHGTIFKITPSGTLTTLHSFCALANCADGQGPVGRLVQDTNGDLYGTTAAGGANGNYGTVFRLSEGLKPFVETQTASGNVGAAVKILGNNLTGATSVSFNGTGASFKVVSKFEITTTVPVGATTGTVQVVTPSGTLSSNVPFRVP